MINLDDRLLTHGLSILSSVRLAARKDGQL